jgi:hypothetical protein
MKNTVQVPIDLNKTIKIRKRYRGEGLYYDVMNMFAHLNEGSFSQDCKLQKASHAFWNAIKKGGTLGNTDKSAAIAYTKQKPLKLKSPLASFFTSRTPKAAPSESTAPIPSSASQNNNVNCLQTQGPSRLFLIFTSDTPCLFLAGLHIQSTAASEVNGSGHGKRLY